MTFWAALLKIQYGGYAYRDAWLHQRISFDFDGGDQTKLIIEYRTFRKTRDYIPYREDIKATDWGIYK